MDISQSKKCWRKACKYLPGGVNSPVRSFQYGVEGGTPRFIRAAQGAYLTDVDGNSYIDYVGSWGAMIVGHNNREVRDYVAQTLDNGMSFGTPTELESELAQSICRIMPDFDRVRMVSSGTEAAMTAIRLARGYTGRERIIKFEGCYHGHCDSLLVREGGGRLFSGLPSSAGVPQEIASLTTVLPYNHCELVRQYFQRYGEEVAAVIVEPIAGNMNMVMPSKQFLTTLENCCHQFSVLLIFDEVMTGFRVALKGAQSLYGVQPDLTVLGKVIGGGMPVGAVGGRGDIMQKLAPMGDVYQAGTLSGHPLAMACGLKTLQIISKPGFYAKLNAASKRLTDGLRTVVAEKHHTSIYSCGVGGMFGMLFDPPESVVDLQSVRSANHKIFRKFFAKILNMGVYFAPSSYESGFISAAHTDREIDATLNKVDDACTALRISPNLK